MAPNTLSPFSSLFLLSIIFLLATTTIINNNNNNFLVHAKQFSNLKTLTISGFDSGATMATQLQFAHSSKVQGIAIFSGLPYYCIKNNLTRSEKCFKQANTIPVEELLDTIQRLFDYYLIDNPNFISLHKIYLQHGSKDRTITREALEKSKELYEALGVKSEYLKTNFDIPSGHALPSIDYTDKDTDKENKEDNKNNNCGEPLRKPYIQNCGVDVVGEALKFLITSLNIKFINETIKDLSADKLKKNLVKIDQRKFKSEYHLMNDFGYLYIPTECQKDETKCNHLHVAFHGCDQLGEEFMVYSGYNRIAELNNIVVFYPMSKPQDIYNPYGCWDFFGTENGDDFRSELYATRIGPQMTTVTLMIEDIGYFMDMKSITERHATEVLIGLALLIIGLIYKFTAPLFKSAPKPKQE
ncbi:hypothetical protein ABK040_014998 [Willaertia magna]